MKTPFAFGCVILTVLCVPMPLSGGCRAGGPETTQHSENDILGQLAEIAANGTGTIEVIINNRPPEIRFRIDTCLQKDALRHACEQFLRDIEEVQEAFCRLRSILLGAKTGSSAWPTNTAQILQMAHAVDLPLYVREDAYILGFPDDERIWIAMTITNKYTLSHLQEFLDGFRARSECPSCPYLKVESDAQTVILYGPSNVITVMEQQVRWLDAVNGWHENPKGIKWDSYPNPKEGRFPAKPSNRLKPSSRKSHLETVAPER